VDAAEQPSPKVAEVFKSSSSIVPSSADLSKFNDEFAKRHAGSPQHLLSVLRARRLLDDSEAAKSSLEKEVVTIIDGNGTTLEDTEDGLRLLKQWRSKEDVVDGYLAKARSKWPEATVFAE
jgi:N-alpha-acetyltransferase 15/16, NatA auxiliary subunit